MDIRNTSSNLAKHFEIQSRFDQIEKKLSKIFDNSVAKNIKSLPDVDLSNMGTNNIAKPNIDKPVGMIDVPKLN